MWESGGLEIKLHYIFTQCPWFDSGQRPLLHGPSKSSLVFFSVMSPNKGKMPKLQSKIINHVSKSDIVRIHAMSCCGNDFSTL